MSKLEETITKIEEILQGDNTGLTIQELADESNIDIYLEEWYYRAHLIVDYISGMTDYHALETFQLLSGIKVDA